jgi:hypothetical protein
MEDRHTPRMHKYGELQTIMMAAVCHVTFSSGLRQFQATWYFLDSVPHKHTTKCHNAAKQ